MDEFNLQLNDFSNYSRTKGDSRRSSRLVRRHNNPDPTPSESFEEPEAEITPIDDKPRSAKTNNRASAIDNEADENQPEMDVETNNTLPQRRRQTQKEQTRIELPGFLRFLRDRRFHIFAGVFFMVIGVVMAIVLYSHLHNAAADQSRVLNSTISEMSTPGSNIKNAGGAFGAWLSHALFTDALGIGAFVIALYFLVIGSCLIGKQRINFWSFTFRALLLTITLSIVTGLVTYFADSAVYWGGTHGHYVNKWLFETSSWIGPIAASIILVAAVVCVFYYPIVKSCRMGWNCLKRLKPAKAEYVDSDYTRSVESSKMLEDKKEIEPEAQPAPASEKPAQTKSEDIPTVFPKKETEESVSFSIDEQPESEPVATAPGSNPERKTAVKQVAFRIDGDDAPHEESATLSLEVDRPDLGAKSAEPDDEPGMTPAVGDELFDPRADLSHFKMPSLDLLKEIKSKKTVDAEELENNKDRIIKTLRDYGIEISSIKATVGPTVTRYEIVPAEGVRISRIRGLEDDIALSLSALGIRIIAPIPGKGTVGIEVPNQDPQTVSMRSMIESEAFNDSRKELPVAIGATVSNEVYVIDVAKMPHALVAGATGQGKSVGLNAIITSLLYKKHPSELKFVLIDPKSVEFSLYSKISSHYLAQLPDSEDAVITKTEEVLAVLNSLCVEMDQRYQLLKNAGVRDIVEYNKRFRQRRLNPEKGHRFLPYIVVIIDEFADLIITAGKEIEIPVTRITQKARAVGIHMIIATQRPSTNVLTGLIKANCPARIAFRVQQMVDSRTILDCPGANQLIGRGDMLYSSSGAMERVQCAFVSTDEVESVVDWIDNQVGYEHPYYLPDPMLAMQNEKSNVAMIAGGGMDRDPLFEECARFIISQPSASTSSLQRRYQIGYNRAGKIMDQMEAAGIVGSAVGNKPRPILVDGPSLELILSQG